MVAKPFGSSIEDAIADPRVSDRAMRVAAGSAGPCFLIGRNEDAARLIGNLEVMGVVDDNARPGETWNGLRVVSSAAVPRGAALVNTATSIRPVDVVRRFSNLAGCTFVSFFELVPVLRIELPAFVSEQRRDWRNCQHEWEHLYERLADEESRRTLCDVLRFRLTADPDWMKNYRVRVGEQYFEPFLALDGEVFVDAGAFDGETSAEFRRQDPRYKAIHAFEPDPQNMARARKRLLGIRDVVFHDCGLSDSKADIPFDFGKGSASKVSSASTSVIHVTTLDDAVEGQVTFIKMDLEGWEIPALRGGARHIAAHRPRLAVAVYHQASDFRDVARFALSCHSDYRIFLRHYTQGWSETVMFFV